MKNEQIACCPVCCSADYFVKFRNIEDLVFFVQGKWDLSHCLTCQSDFLSTRPVLVDSSLAYSGYAAHQKLKQKRRVTNSWVKNFRRTLALGFLAQKLHYPYRTSFSQRILIFFLGCIFKSNMESVLTSVLFQPFVEKGKLLEIGCGSGALLLELQQHGWLVQGIDIDSNSVALAKEVGLDVSCGTLVEKQYPSGTFDAICSKHVIEHVYDLRPMVGEMYRVLKKNGTVSLITPNVRSATYRFFGRYWRCVEPPRHLQLFSSSAIKKMFEDAGFIDVRVCSISRNRRYNWKVSREIFEHSGKKIGIRYIFSLTRYVVESFFLRSFGDELVLVASK